MSRFLKALAAGFAAAVVVFLLGRAKRYRQTAQQYRIDAAERRVENDTGVATRLDSVASAHDEVADAAVKKARQKADQLARMDPDLEEIFDVWKREAGK